MSTELYPHAGPYEFTQPRAHCPAAAPQNISTSERNISLLGGAGLALYGLGRGGPFGLLTALAGGALMYRGWTGWCHLYEALGINSAVDHDDRGGVKARQGSRITRSIHINREPRELYDFWRKLENLPSVMGHLLSVEELDDQRSRWTARSPVGPPVAWEAEIITDRPGELIAWSSLPDSQVDTAGSVHFLPAEAGGGTELYVTLKYDPPGGRVTEQIAHLFGRGLEDKLDEDLHAFKHTMEAREQPAVG
jgi:uncharacterized membrane protein